MTARVPSGGEGPGLREALWSWAIWGVVAVTVIVTYARLPAAAFYNVTGTGLWSGLARALVLLGWPVSPAALALMAVAVDRLLAAPLEPGPRRSVIAAAIAAAVLCATIAVPGVVKQSDLDAKPANLAAGIGVLTALGLTLFALRRTGAGRPGARGRGDRIALRIAALYTLAALPWIFANLGFYVGDVPVLHHIFMSRKVLPEAGHPHLRAVHLGNHEGLDGWLLAVTALLLRPALARMRPTRLRPALGGYLALLVAYGVMVSANDGWNEQIVKRGWTSHGPPSVLTPALNLGWAILIAVAVVLYLAAFRVRAGEREPVLA